jgi:type I restriction enzyme S subunit
MQELLKPQESWITRPIGHFADLYQPETISQEQFTDDGYLVYGANGIVGRYFRYNHDIWQITITCRAQRA